MASNLTLFFVLIIDLIGLSSLGMRYVDHHQLFGWIMEGVKPSTPELVVLPPGSLVTCTVLHTTLKL